MNNEDSKISDEKEITTETFPAGLHISTTLNQIRDMWNGLPRDKAGKLLAVVSIIPGSPVIITPDNTAGAHMMCVMIDPSFMASVPDETRAQIFAITSQYFHDLAQNQMKVRVP